MDSILYSSQSHRKPVSVNADKSAFGTIRRNRTGTKNIKPQTSRTSLFGNDAAPVISHAQKRKMSNSSSQGSYALPGRLLASQSQEKLNKTLVESYRSIAPFAKLNDSYTDNSLAKTQLFKQRKNSATRNSSSVNLSIPQKQKEQDPFQKDHISQSRRKNHVRASTSYKVQKLINYPEEKPHSPEMNTFKLAAANISIN